MDNRRIDLTLDSHLPQALHLAFGQRAAIGYRIHENTMVFYWAESDKMLPLPFKMDASAAVSFVEGWLKNTKPSYSQPDHDGDNGPGFRIFNEGWGHVFGEWQAFIAIESIWAVYGK